MLKKGELYVGDCFYTIDDTEFRKVRPGLNQDRSPIQCRDPRLDKKRHTIQS